MKKVFSLALVAGMFAFSSCETKTESTTIESTDATSETMLEGDTVGTSTTTIESTTIDTTAVVQ